MVTCPVCRDPVASHCYANVYRCNKCQHTYTVDKVPGENPPEPVDSRPDPPPAPPEPKRMCEVCDGRGYTLNHISKRAPDCGACKGTGQVAEPVDSRPPEPSGHHDASDNRITQAEAQAKGANIRCDVLVASVVALQERAKVLEWETNRLRERCNTMDKRAEALEAQMELMVTASELTQAVIDKVVLLGPTK